MMLANTILLTAALLPNAEAERYTLSGTSTLRGFEYRADKPACTWEAAPSHFDGESYIVEVSFEGHDGAMLDGWALTAGAVLVDGEPAGERDESRGKMVLASGGMVSAKIDIGAALAGKSSAEVSFASEYSNAAAITVNVFKGLTEAIDFVSVGDRAESMWKDSGSAREYLAPVEGARTIEDAEISKYGVVIVTNVGQMSLELWPDVAPAHCRNFLDLVSRGYYDGTKFHRVMPGFMIQGGCPNTKDKHPSQWGVGSGPRNIKAEFNAKKHTRGVLSTARGPSPDSASSQFFVMHGPATHLDGQYTAFGKLLEGEDVLDNIANASGTPIPGVGGTRPSDDKTILKARIVVLE